MSYFLSYDGTTVKGKRYRFYTLREAVWDKVSKTQKNRYVGYAGTDAIISISMAEKIMARGLNRNDLLLAGVTVVGDEEFVDHKQARRGLLAGKKRVEREQGELKLRRLERAEALEKRALRKKRRKKGKRRRF